jgi:hypothetical protein
MSFLWIYEIDEAGECLCGPFGRHVAPRGNARRVRRRVVLPDAGGMSAQLAGKEKSEARNSKQIRMPKIVSSKQATPMSSRLRSIRTLYLSRISNLIAKGSVHV